jgi:hypothetical protein
MKRSDKDIIKEFIELTGSEKAPSGFSRKVMSRIELEKDNTYINPISRTFILIVILTFTGLVILALTLPRDIEYPWMKSVIENISGFLTRIPDSIQIPGISIIARYLFYISAGIIVFTLIDRFLAKFLIPGKRYIGQE